ncbi:hypothetical protein ACHAXA_007617 [Cyclostephanos tholiformis]|uniref:Uncharacterized protein n=1 Tax=Cyclostephanos tholiformis TaxID=382380 RepID=A0ABD3R4R2_9STRA
MGLTRRGSPKTPHAPPGDRRGDDDDEGAAAAAAAEVVDDGKIWIFPFDDGKMRESDPVATKAVATMTVVTTIQQQGLRYASINLSFLALLASRESTRTRVRRAWRRTGGERKGTYGRGIVTPSIATAAPSLAPKGCLEARPCLLDPAPDDDEDDDAGSSRLFQPHRTLGLLTSSRPRMSDNRRSSLFSSNFGKFHLQGRTQSSDESFLTVPIGERFQILTLSKLVPVLVSRALPPSAAHHRRRRRSSRGGEGSHRYEGGDEEEAHKAVSDSSLSVTVATHGPRVLGRAVSVTLFSRTRPIACLDAFPFARRVDAKKRGTWGIVDVIDLGRHRVDMRGEKEGRSENALLFAIVCARGDSSGAPRPREDGAGGGNDDVRGGGGEADDDVLIVGEDSEDESSVDGRKVDEGAESDPSDDASGDDDDDEGSSSSGGSMKSLDDVERSGYS